MLKELKQLTIDYTKQETLDPIKGLLRFIAWGTLGSVAIGIGLVLCTMSLLRALQGETAPHFTNHLTWVPYLITFAACFVIAALAAFTIKKDHRADAKRRAEKEVSS